MKLFYTLDEEDFFGLEYKRVRSDDTDLARLYVTEGMMRFVSAKYCPGHEVVGMVGFVMDADAKGSVDGIREQIRSHRLDLTVQDDWADETDYPGVESLYRTRHIQRGYTSPLTMLHILLPFDIATSTSFAKQLL